MDMVVRATDFQRIDGSWQSHQSAAQAADRRSMAGPGYVWCTPGVGGSSGDAIKHGNRQDPTKRIDVELRLSPERVQIEIGDEGVGFDPASVPDPTDDRNLELPTGRGLMLMRSYMTSVQFNDQGNRVVMEKRRTQLSAVE